MTKFKKFTGIFFLFLFCFSGYAQNELNPYKYIIVPKQYDFLKKENQYRVNSMTKYLFEQDGFTTLYQGDEYPADLNANPCLAATAIVLNESSAFTTKLVLMLKDCRDKEIFRTVEGKSKIKEFDKTYIDALKKSFVSIQNLDYTFEESLVMIILSVILLVLNKRYFKTKKDDLSSCIVVINNQCEMCDNKAFYVRSNIYNGYICKMCHDFIKPESLF